MADHDRFPELVSNVESAKQKQDKMESMLSDMKKIGRHGPSKTIGRKSEPVNEFRKVGDQPPIQQTVKFSADISKDLEQVYKSTEQFAKTLPGALIRGPYSSLSIVALILPTIRMTDSAMNIDRPLYGT